MARSNTNLITSILILSLLVLAPVSNACSGCTTPTPVTPAPPVTCPIDVLKLAACADVLGLVHAVIGTPPSGTPCCTLIKGLANLEVAACLCTAIKGNVLGLNLNIPIALSVIASACQKTIPDGFKCP